MKITKQQAKKLKNMDLSGTNKTTDRVEPEVIQEVRPSEDGFTVIYKNLSEVVFVASIAKVEKIEWRKEPSKEWIYVHWISIQDIHK